MKKSNKGFTLIEVIIAISILTIVLGMGYTIINGTNKTVKKQEITNNGQNSVNIVNKYLTGDIEKIIEKPSIQIFNINDNDYVYIYKLKTKLFKQNNQDINCVEYKVSVDGEFNDSKTNFKGKYSVIRTSKKIERDNSENILGNIEIVSDLPVEYKDVNSFNIEDISPLKIEPSGELFDVSLDYQDNQIKEYKFSVTPRLVVVKGEDVEVSEDETEGEIEPPKLPDIEIPEDELRNMEVLGYLGFWAADSKIAEKNKNLAIWSTFKHASDKNKHQINFGGHNCNTLKKHEIKATVNGNAGNEDVLSISGKELLKVTTENVKKCNKVSVYVSKGTKLDGFKINGKDYSQIDATTIDKKYIKVNIDVSMKWGLNIEGNMQITGKDGHVFILYGHEK